MPKERRTIYRGGRWVGKRVHASDWRGQVSWYVLTAAGWYGIHARMLRGCCRSSFHPFSSSSGAVIGPASHVWGYPSVKKVKLAERASVKHLAALETEAFRDLMPVVEQLALLQYEDGSARQPGFLMIWVDGSTWVVVAKDKDAGAQLKCVGRTLDEALGTLALMLGSDDAPWELDGKAARLGAQRRK